MNLASGGVLDIETPLIGSGTIDLTGGMGFFFPTTLYLGGPVGSTQSIDIAGGLVDLIHSETFAGVIAVAAGTTGQIELSGVVAASLQYLQTTASGGELDLFAAGGQQVGAVALRGAYQPTDFALLPLGSSTLVNVTPHPA